MSVAPELLWDYVLGTLDDEERARVDRELEKSPALRAEVAEIGELACALPLALDPVRPPPALKERLLESVASPKRFTPWVEKLARLFDVSVERARTLMDLTYDTAAWVPSGMPGCALIHLQGGPATVGADVGFVRVEPGFQFPEHDHNGDEETLVIQGAYRDSYDGSVARAGDIVVRPKGSNHEFVVEPDEDCIYATVVHDGLTVTATEGPGAGWTVASSKKGS